MLFATWWQVLAGLASKSKTLLQRKRHLSRQEPESDLSAEHAVKEGVYEIKRLMANEPEAVPIPAMSHDHVPKSPPHHLEISDSDGSEVIDYWANEAADHVNAKYVVAGMPMDFIGNTCRQVCTTCIIAAESYPECGCRASCMAGSDGSKCKSKNMGWSNEKVTTPKTSWKAKCNAGQIDCHECMDEEVKEKMANCKKKPIPAICEHDLKMALAKPETPTYYCTQDNEEGAGLATCDTFLYKPKENGWTCFDKEWECKNSKTDLRESMTAYEKTIPPIETPCVWCDIPIKKAGDGK